MFGKDLVKLKGNRCGVTGIIWHALKEREKGEDFLVATIDEFMTSRICNLCYEDSLEKMNGVKSQSALGYGNCKTLWQKDVNATKNMLLISPLMGVVMVIQMCFLLKQDPEFNLYRRTKHGFFPR